MDNLITFLIIIAVIVSIFKNLARKKISSSENVDYEEYEDEDYNEYEEEVPDSIKELWSKFQGDSTVVKNPPPPIPEKNVLSEEVAYKRDEKQYKPIRHEVMDEKPIVHKPIVHKKTSDEFKRPFFREEKVEKPEILIPLGNNERKRVRLTAKELKKAVILSEILAKPVSMRD